MNLTIKLDEVDDLARGAAILGTGGGGDPYLGSLMLRQALLDGSHVSVIDVEELADEDFVATSALMGAPTVIIEKAPNGGEMLAALRSLERICGAQARAILCAEIGGLNALLPLVLAARCGLPVVNGDGMGRAFPETQMIAYHILGIKAAPLAMADEYCNTVVIQSASTLEIERLGRSMVVAMGGVAGTCSYSMRGRDAKRVIVRNTLSIALGIGRTVREARGKGVDPFAALLGYLGATEYYKHCHIIFEGKNVDILSETKLGFTLGKVLIEGTGSCVGRRLSIKFQNEHLMARDDERVLAIVPDLIAVLDATTAEPITTEGLKYGQRVAILACSAPPVLRSPDGLSVCGPQAFGLTERFVPIEQLTLERSGDP